MDPMAMLSALGGKLGDVGGDEAFMQEVMAFENRPRLYCSPGVSEADRDTWSRWPCVYPHYLDASRTRVQGRRVSSQEAVVNPSAFEILAFAVNALKLRAVFEDKCYPRDFLLRGRVRVELMDLNTGLLFREDLPTKHDLLKSLAKLFHEAQALGLRSQAALGGGAGISGESAVVGSAAEHGGEAGGKAKGKAKAAAKKGNLSGKKKPR